MPDDDNKYDDIDGNQRQSDAEEVERPVPGVLSPLDDTRQKPPDNRGGDDNQYCYRYRRGYTIAAFATASFVRALFFGWHRFTYTSMVVVSIMGRRLVCS